MKNELENFADDDFCYLTTTGRVTGQPHTIEIWFAIERQTLYMLSGGGAQSDWVKNLLRAPDVTIRIRDAVFSGQARLVEDPDEDALARRIVVGKYQPRDADDLTEWGRTAFPIAVSL